MAQLDGSLAEPTPTGRVADRAFCYRTAVKLLEGASLVRGAEPDDVLALARFLAGDDF